EERDYMYRYYAHDPDSRINLGIRRRLAPLLGKNRRRIELLNVLLFSLPGTPIIYYGDEIGMGDNHYLGDRDGVRTPMQWDDGRNAGFSQSNPQQLFLPVIIDPEYHYHTVNVAIEDRNPSSLLWWMRRMINMRNRFQAFARGSFEHIHCENSNVFAFIRRLDSEIVLVVINLSRFAQSVELELGEWQGYQPVDVFSLNRFAVIQAQHWQLTMGMHDYFWLQLLPEKRIESPPDYEPLELDCQEPWTSIFAGRLKERIESELLPRYLGQRNSAGLKRAQIRNVTIQSSSIINTTDLEAVLLLLRVSYSQAEADTIFLPLAACSANEALEWTANNRGLIFARIAQTARYLIDAAWHPGFHRSVHRILMDGGSEVGAPPEIRCQADQAGSINLERPREIHLAKAGRRNTTFLYDNGATFKLFRRLEPGINPDIEMISALNRSRPDNRLVPVHLGSCALLYKDKQKYVFGMLNQTVTNTGLVWQSSQEAALQFFDQILSGKTEQLAGAAFQLNNPFSPPQEKVVSFLEETAGLQLSALRHLASQLALLHIQLAEIAAEPDFQPESFSTLYQRSLYQSMQSRLKKVYALIDRLSRTGDDRMMNACNSVLALRPSILHAYQFLLAAKLEARKIRIHGDLHLGQILQSGGDFIFKDFEGRGDRALSERRIKRSPIRDLASLIQSLHRASYQALHRQIQLHEKDIDFIRQWIPVYFSYQSIAMLNSYHEAIKDSQLVPAEYGSFIQFYSAFQFHQSITTIGRSHELYNDPFEIQTALQALLDVHTFINGTASPSAGEHR
ncbi:MAG: alpha-glucosidase C-terminal domain-containing protein, partial [Leptospiraceae bacterium]|nr:alpha-glucosidase C-terminal domain-containing protein [Leptospiraceae bacterium]